MKKAQDTSSKILCVCIITIFFTISCGGGGAGDPSDTTSSKVWGTAVLIEPNTENALHPEIAMNAGGNAVAVWYQSDGANYHIWANRYVASVGWGTPVLIETGTGGADAPQVAMDYLGNVCVVWSQSDGTRDNIWTNRYNAAGWTWGTAELIETDNAGSAEHPQVAMNSDGDAIAVWSQSDGTRYNIWANRRPRVGYGWGTPVLIETDDTGDAKYPQVAIDSGGNAIAVWQQYDGAHWNIWANRYVAGTGWGTAELIETGTRVASLPQVAMDASGNAIAVWEQGDGTVYNIWANRYVAGAGWGTAVLIETDNTWNNYDAQVAMDPNGNAIAVWKQYDGTRHNIWANRYVAGAGWGSAVLIETGTGDTDLPQVAMDSGGNAIAVWDQSDGTQWNIWANRYVAGTGWGTAELIEADNARGIDPRIAMNSDGNAIVVRSQSDGARFHILANHFQ